MANRRGLDSRAAFGGGSGFGVQQFSAPGAESGLGAPAGGGFGAPPGFGASTGFGASGGVGSPPSRGGLGFGTPSPGGRSPVGAGAAPNLSGTYDPATA